MAIEIEPLPPEEFQAIVHRWDHDPYTDPEVASKDIAALIDEVQRFQLALDGIANVAAVPEVIAILRRLSTCRSSWSKQWNGITSCRELREDARQNPSRYAAEYRTRLLANEQLCDGCVAADALARLAETPGVRE